MIVPRRLVRFAILRPGLLLKGFDIRRALVRVDPVAPFTNGIAKHGVHGVYAVFDRGVRGVDAYGKSGLTKQGNVRLAGIDRPAGIAGGVWIYANLTRRDIANAVISPVAFLDTPDHVGRVVPIDKLIHGAGQAVAAHMHNSRHAPHIEVHADEQRFSRPDRLVRRVVLPLEAAIDRAGIEVDEFTVDIGVDQLRRVGFQQRGDVVRRQVDFIVICAGLDDAVQLAQLRIFTRPLLELLIDELEPFRRGGHIDAVTQPFDVVAHAGKYLPPRDRRLVHRHHVDLVNKSVPDLETDDAFRLVHGAAFDDAAQGSATVDKDLVRRLLYIDGKAPLLEAFRHGRVKDVPDLRIRRREVPGIDTRPLTKMTPKRSTAGPSLTAIVMERKIPRQIVIIPCNMYIPEPILDLQLFNAYNPGYGYGAIFFRRKQWISVLLSFSNY